MPTALGELDVRKNRSLLLSVEGQNKYSNVVGQYQKGNSDRSPPRETWPRSWEAIPLMWASPPAPETRPRHGAFWLGFSRGLPMIIPVIV
jgi:hypothetical protein